MIEKLFQEGEGRKKKIDGEIIERLRESSERVEQIGPKSTRSQARVPSPRKRRCLSLSSFRFLPPIDENINVIAMVGVVRIQKKSNFAEKILKEERNNFSKS